MFIKFLAAREIKISMDRNGAWQDNAFVDGLWRTIKFEEVFFVGLCQRVGGPCRDLPISRLKQQPTLRSSRGRKTPETCSDKPNGLCDLLWLARLDLAQPMAFFSAPVMREEQILSGPWSTLIAEGLLRHSMIGFGDRTTRSVGSEQ